MPFLTLRWNPLDRVLVLRWDCIFRYPHTYMLNLAMIDLTEYPLISVGMMLVIGYLLGRGAEKVRLPEISGFLMTGFLMGPYMGNIITSQGATDLLLVTEIALGLICFTIGAELYLPKLHRQRRQVGWITTGQIVGSFGLVFLLLRLASVELPFAFLLAAVAGTTSPAATVVIVQSLRARGVYVDYLFGTVALGDVVAIVLFSIIFAVAPALLGLVVFTSVYDIIVPVALRMGLSIVLGLAGGVVIHIITRRHDHNGEILIVTAGIIVLGSAVATSLGLSPLLLNIASGGMVVNMSARNVRIFRTLEPLTPPIYALFFVIAGTKLDPALLVDPTVLLLGSLFVLGRGLGKYAGTRVVMSRNKMDATIRRWLGISLLPQAGIALGLILMLPQLNHGGSDTVQAGTLLAVNVVLFAVFVNEVAGPPLSRLAVVRGNRMEAQ